jgi:hypothetical protein
MADPAASPSRPSLKRPRDCPVGYDEDSVEDTLRHLVGLVFDSLEPSPGSLVTLQRLLELTRAQTNAVLWKGLGGPSDTSNLAGSRFTTSSADGVFFHAVNAVAGDRFGTRLNRIRGKAATKGPPCCMRWHVAGVAEGM